MAKANMGDTGRAVTGMSDTQKQFIQERDLLLTPKEGQTARGLAEELVRLMELLAVHGSTGIRADPDTREDYVDTLRARIYTAVRLEPARD